MITIMITIMITKWIWKILLLNATVSFEVFDQLIITYQNLKRVL